MTPADITHDAWGILIMVLLGGAAGMRLLYGAFTSFLTRVGDGVIKAAGDLSSTLQKIEALLHESERAAVTRDRDKSSELHELEQRLRQDFHLAIRDDGARTREALRNLRLDVLQAKRAESIEDAIASTLHDSQDPVPEAKPDHA